jgi:hypothetical protein
LCRRRSGPRPSVLTEHSLLADDAGEPALPRTDAARMSLSCYVGTSEPCALKKPRRYLIPTATR